MNMNDSTPPLLRGLGAFVFLVAAILGAIESMKTARNDNSLARAEIRFDTSKPFHQLSDQEKKERGYHIVINNLSDKIERLSFIANITTEPKIAPLTYLGLFLGMSSYFVEWLVKKKKMSDSPSANA